MPRNPLPSPETPDTLTVRVGRWFEANGTGRGVMVIPILLALLVISAALARWWT